MQAPAWTRATGYWFASYKRVWRSSVFTSFILPLLYLIAIGFAVGKSVDANGSADRIGGVAYLAYLAPGLLGASTMQSAAQEAMWPVMGAWKWTRQYLAMIATPLSIDDVMIGHLAFIAIRSMLNASVFAMVITLVGAARSPWLILAVPAAALSAVAAVMPLIACSMHLEQDNGFNALNRFVVVPMFLFSGTFFPVAQLPTAIRPIAYVTPLYHGVDLCRRLALGNFGSVMLLHIAVLAAYGVVGLVLSRRCYTRRLAP